MDTRACNRFAAMLSLVLSCTIAACSSSSPPEEGTPLSELYALMLASPGLDSDGDDIPDDVELHPDLGTDPHKADSDGDGLLDNFEIFGPSFLFIATGGQGGVLDLDPVLPDTNGNGIHAALDPDERNEQFMIDSDHDGVVNYLEYYGYTYNWSTGTFVKWTHEDRVAYPDVPWFKTDPLQPSTDQDAYSDGLEVSRAMMDAAVREPGDHPLVPAYPNIVVRLEGYAITLNEQITYSKGGSLSKGQSWNRETTRTHSYSEHYDWEVGVEAGYTNGGGHIVGHFNFAWGNETTNTTSTSVAVGGSVNEEVNWDRARSYNPTDAAHIKLFLKVENCGTAPASNVIPTLNLRVGGSNVATFEQANFKIHMLMPGESYPEGNSVYWVVDAIDTGTGMVPLALTEFELKAVESGAPINLAVTQVQADVMLLDGDGTWQRAGDINEYLSRCQAVSANVFADVGDGKFLHHLIYADDEPTGPVVTLSDALKWSMGGREENGQVFIEYRSPNGTTEEIALTKPGEEGWTVHVDGATFDRRTQGDAPWDMRLGPDSHVELIAPRASASDPPAIYDAYAVPLEEGYEVVCCASDYDGIDKVVFIDRDGAETRMEQDGRGPWFFSCEVPADYEFEGGELVQVTSINTSAAAAYQEIGPIHTVVSEPPLVSRLIYDGQNRRLEAKVEAGGSLAEDAVTWVRLYHPGFLASHTGEDADGYVTMEETVYWFEEPYIYECLLPNGWISGMRVVAHSAGGQYTSVDVKDVATLKPYGSGQVVLQAEMDWTATDAWQVPQVDLDVLPTGSIPLLGDHSWWTAPWGNFHGGGSHFDDGWPADGITYLRSNGPPADIYVRSWGDDDNTSWFGLGCQESGTKADSGDMGSKSPDVYYLELTEKEVLALSMKFVDGVVDRVSTGSVFAFRTTDGRYGKLIVRQANHWDDDDCFFACWPNWDKLRVTCDYVLFRKSGDGDAPPSMSYSEPDAYYSVGQAITINEPEFAGEGDPVDTFTVSPALPAGLSLDPDTGFISGTPTATQGLLPYVVTGENTAGSTTATVRIGVLASPSGLSYASPVSCSTGDAMPPKTPSVSGDVDSYSISPALPTGLKIDETTGVIAGTPVQVTSQTTYTVTASNAAGGSTTAAIKIATPLGAPKNLSYAVTNAQYEINKGILPNTPTVTNSVDEWSISPALPAGLVFDTSSGYISGTPTSTSSTTTYTVVAKNSAGVTTASITIQVYAPP